MQLSEFFGLASDCPLGTVDVSPTVVRRVRLVGLALVALLATSPAAFAQAAATPKAPDTMEARMLACASCHGPHGEGTDNDYFPRLAGKPSGYLANQLIAFRDGRRRY